MPEASASLAIHAGIYILVTLSGLTLKELVQPVLGFETIPVQLSFQVAIRLSVSTVPFDKKVTQKSVSTVLCAFKGLLQNSKKDDKNIV